MIHETAERQEPPAREQAGYADGAFEQILEQYERLIWHIARRYFDNDEDAEDACQEAVVKIYKGLPRVAPRADGSLKSWVCAVTANACVDVLRKKRITTEPLTDGERLAEGGTAVELGMRLSAPSAEDTVLARERRETILRAIARLPADHRLLIILRDMNGLSYQELAEATGIGINTVKSRLSRARVSLRTLLDTL